MQNVAERRILGALPIIEYDFDNKGCHRLPEHTILGGWPQNPLQLPSLGLSLQAPTLNRRERQVPSRPTHSHQECLEHFSQFSRTDLNHSVHDMGKALVMRQLQHGLRAATTLLKLELRPQRSFALERWHILLQDAVGFPGSPQPWPRKPATHGRVSEIRGALLGS